MIQIEDIRSGLRNGEFFLEYQPFVRLADGHCTGAEALLRWRRNGGVTLPDCFIPLAENTSVSGLLTYWVIDTAADELGDWLRKNGSAQLSINVPPEILGRGGLEYAAHKAGITDLAGQIVLEVTERGIPDQIGLNALNSLSHAGVRIALDDVTPGGLNLAVLSRGNFDLIKLDRQMVAEVRADCDMPKWLKAVAALAGSRHVHLVAEGIETQLQYDALRDAGVQEGQGYYFSPAMSALQLIDYHARVNGV